MENGETPKFTPSMMPRRRIVPAERIVAATVDASPVEVVEVVPSTEPAPQTAGHEPEAQPRPTKPAKLVKEVLHDEEDLVRSIRRALGGGNPDMFGRKKTGRGKSFRYT